MEYPYDDWVPGFQIIQGRPRRERMNSERTRHGYWQGETLVVPGAGGIHRSASTGGNRPQNIIINNEMDQNQDTRSRSRDRRRSRSRHRHRDESSSDSDWDEREHQRRHRHRRHDSGSRSPSPYMDYKTEKQLEKLKELEAKEAKERQEAAIKQEMLIKKAKEEAEKAERKKREDEIKKKAIEDYNREQAEKKLKADKEKAEADKLFEERVRMKFLEAGYSEEEALRVLKGKKKEKERESRELDVYDRNKTTFVKVHRKYLLPETLDHYHLPWEWDDRDGNYIIIKRWVEKEVQDDLFEHTRKIKERKLIAYETPKEQKDKLYIVRKKSPARKSWMFT